MAFGRGGRGLLVPLLTANLVAHLIIVGLAGWSLNEYNDGEQHHPHLGGNPATSMMLTFALLAGVIGICSVLYGLLHFRAWRSDSMAAASALAVTSFAVNAIALGFVCKEISLGGHRGKRLQTLEAFILISLISQLLYVGLLHAGLFNSRYGPSYCH